MTWWVPYVRMLSQILRYQGVKLSAIFHSLILLSYFLIISLTSSNSTFLAVLPVLLVALRSLAFDLSIGVCCCCCRFLVSRTLLPSISIESVSLSLSFSLSAALFLFLFLLMIGEKVHSLYSFSSSSCCSLMILMVLFSCLRHLIGTICYFFR